MYMLYQRAEKYKEFTNIKERDGGAGIETPSDKII